MKSTNKSTELITVAGNGEQSKKISTGHSILPDAELTIEANGTEDTLVQLGARLTNICPEVIQIIGIIRQEIPAKLEIPLPHESLMLGNGVIP